MRKYVLPIILTLGLLLVGCAAPAIPPSPPGPVEPAPVPVPAPEPVPLLEPAVEPTVEAPEGLVGIGTEGLGAPKEGTWIMPGKVMIEGLYPGAQAEWYMSIHNGGEESTVFSITPRTPDYTAEGYERLPESYLTWVTIADPSPILQSKETRDILVIVKVPEGTETFQEKVEVWISIKDMSQTGMVRTELCSRWLITMRD